MNILVISCSLHPQSRSYILARQTIQDLQALGVAPILYDLRDLDLPFCDAVSAHKTETSLAMIKAIEDADAILMAVPIYNYDVNAAAKNLLELGLRAWNNKIVGFICAAGGRASYMSVMSLANSLMLDFRCLIVPRFVYATGSDFGDDRQPTMHITSDVIKERLQELAATTVHLAKALRAN
ncbi:MAG: NAD(P)H-dependent oxidoreductase [Caldilineaceae bacterium]